MTVANTDAEGCGQAEPVPTPVRIISSELPEDQIHQRLRKHSINIILFCAIGLVVSLELAKIHWFVHTDPTYHSICAVSRGLNCETVASSPYSVFWGLPVAVWGILAYAVMGLVALSAITRQRLHPTWPWGLLSTLATCSVAVSAILGYISATQISSFCAFCMASYLINGFLFWVCCVALKTTQSSVLSAIKSDLGSLARRPRVAAAVLGSGLALVGTAEALVPAYWSTSKWSTLPKLSTGTDEQGHHWLGGCKPAITVVEYSDYECPHCRAAHKQMRELAAKYPNEIRLIHRHLPLDMQCHPGLRKPFHLRACLFAEAAECAGLQGRFWDMNDALFSAQETAKATNVNLADLAVRIGLNRMEFERCLESHQTLPKVADDIQVALARGLEGTPSFLVGDQLYLGSIPESELLSRLQNHVAAQPSALAFPQGQSEFCDGSRHAGGIASASP